MVRRKDDLERYKQKRDFTKTPEPKGITEKQGGRHYLIQKHAATRLHYDFRLELDGVLKSWAVTRGPSLDPHEKRLAVEVEDHPVAYGSFEGIIPKGQYGGGTVMLWDEGEWEPIGDPHKGLKAGKLEFKLHGKRLHGEWTLVRMRDREKDRGRHNWLLIKHRDGDAKNGDADKLLEKNNTSVVSGRSMEKIASAADHVWGSKTTKTQPAKVAAKIKTKGKKSGPLPAFITPELATLVDRMPEGKGWVHEVKFDGYRAIACISGDKVKMYTRNHNDWTHTFQPIADLFKELPADSAVIDGEIIVPDKEGISSFTMLKKALSEGALNKLQYYAFDLMQLNGRKLTKLPLLERKAELEKLLKVKAFKDKIIYSEHFENKDQQFLDQLCSMRLEGVISKLASSPYRGGRGKAWLKSKCHKRQEFVIGGFTLPTHEHRGIGSLLLGYYDGDVLEYAGRVGTGFDTDTSSAIRKKLDKLAVKAMPYGSVSALGKRGAHWVRPQMACEVEFTEWTEDGHLRHPSFQGLREDKDPRSIIREAAEHLTKEKVKLIEKKEAKAAPKATRSAKTSSKDGNVGGIRISHPERLIYPGTDITKLELAEYYLSVADHMLPHIANRPLSMVRCPEGSGEPCFFQRHIAQGQSPYLHDTGIPVKGRTEDYMMIKDKNGLITLIQWGVIELHPWGCKADKPTQPDRIIFDLDPDPAVEWKHMVEAAKEVRARMQELGLESFLKTTGGKGLHIVVPFQRQYGFPTIKAFARMVAESMASDRPERYIATMSKEKRKGKIFVDYLRNDLTSTAVAPYSARAREGATVATPIFWEELRASLRPAGFTIETVPKRLAKLKSDPWEEMLTIKQKLSAKYLKALGIKAE